jgi:3-mercaptopyruvate sulfurtransferase SseA
MATLARWKAEQPGFAPRRAARSIVHPIMAYCRIGERSAHTWFVLHELQATTTSSTATDRGPGGAAS